MENINIRKLEKGDFPSIMHLLHQLDGFTDSPSNRNLSDIELTYSKMDQSHENYLNFVATLDDKVVGFLSMVFYDSFLHRRGTALINELIVEEQKRGIGVGEALIKAAISNAKKKRVEEIEVGTESSNRAAKRFYMKQGFTHEFVLLEMEL